MREITKLLNYKLNASLDESKKIKANMSPMQINNIILII